jgi:hypothetical protein
MRSRKMSLNLALRLPARINRNSRFGPLFRTAYTSPALDTRPEKKVEEPTHIVSPSEVEVFE